MRRYVAVLCSVALVLTLASCAASFTPVVTETSQPSPTLAPTVAAGPAVLARAAQPEGWLIYSSPELHFSFAYPSRWSLYAPDWQPGDAYNAYILTLFPPADDPLGGNKIEIFYPSFEIPDSQSLQTWVELSYRVAADGDPPPTVTVISQQTLTEPDGSPRQVLHATASAVSGPSQVVLLTRGRLVLSLVSYTHSEAMGEVLKGIAASIQFDAGAPRTLNELYGTERVWSSLEEVQQRLDTIRQNAIPTCDIVCRDAETSKQVLPTPTATPGPTP